VQPLRILIVRLGAMGDVLHALPAVSALRATLPGCQIGWAIEPQWTALLRATSAAADTSRGSLMPVIDHLHIVPAKQWARRPLSAQTLRSIRAVRRELRSQHYDLAIDLQGAIRSAWIGRMAHTPRLVGEQSPREPLARWLFSERAPTTGVHVIEQAREVVEQALQKTRGALPDCAPDLPRDPAAEQWVDAWLAERSIRQFVLMNPGAGWGAKCWPAERYAEVAQQIAAAGFPVVVNAGPNEIPLAETLGHRAGPQAFVMSGSLDTLIASTRRAALFIGGDTGPLHLAAALRIPVIGIYGPTDPARNGPWGTRATVLRHPQSRRDHARRSQPEAGLLTITSASVVAAAMSLLPAKAQETR
jgi:heptosyltransferase-1